MPEYVKTGKSPGRPRKDGTPAQSRPVKAKGPKVTRAEGFLGPQPALICEECFPAGWPAGWSAAPCQHMIATRRL